MTVLNIKFSFVHSSVFLLSSSLSFFLLILHSSWIKHPGSLPLSLSLLLSLYSAEMLHNAKKVHHTTHHNEPSPAIAPRYLQKSWFFCERATIQCEEFASSKDVVVHTMNYKDESSQWGSPRSTMRSIGWTSSFSVWKMKGENVDCDEWAHYQRIFLSKLIVIFMEMHNILRVPGQHNSPSCCTKQTENITHTHTHTSTPYELEK